MSRVVIYEKSLVLHVVADRGWSDQPITLTYDVKDPFAVRLTFTRDAIVWSVGRDLLNQALTRPSGTGDVRLWPSIDVTADVLYLNLRAPSGEALMECKRSTIAQFIAQTEAMVPFGSETLLDLDDELRTFNREQENP